MASVHCIIILFAIIVVCGCGSCAGQDDKGCIIGIRNVSSVWYFPSNSLQVTWEWNWNGVEDFMNVSVVWSAIVPPNLGGNLCNELHNTTCIIKNVQVANIIHFRVSVLVKGMTASNNHTKEQNRTNLTSSTVSNFEGVFDFSVNPKKAVKTGPPARLKVTSTSSRCWNISWVNPKFFDQLNEAASYSIILKKVKTVDSKRTYQTNPLSSNTNKTNMAVSLCGLDPGTLYSLTLRVKPMDYGHWSNPFTVYNRTLEDKPVRGPEITETSFWSGPCVGGKREIILYWKDTPYEIANGELTHFIIKLTSMKFKIRSSNHVNIFIHCNKTNLVEIYSATAAGVTDSPSSLIIPSIDKEMETPNGLNFQVTKMDNTSGSNRHSLNVTWVCHQPIVCMQNVIDIYYCRGESFSSNICIDDIQHQRVSLQSETFVLRNISDRINRFGFALSDGIGELQGITWTNCVFDVNKKPPVPSGVTAFRGESQNSIIVKWTSISCQDNGGALVISYNVTYCTNGTPEGKEPCQEMTVNGSTSTAVIKGLDMGRSYTIKVVAVSPAGKSPASSLVTVTTGHWSYSTDYLKRSLYIVFGVIIVLVASVVLVILVRKFKHRMASIKKELAVIHAITSDVYVCEDEDSGHSSYSDPT